MAEHIPLNSVQKAVFDILTNDATLVSLGVTVTEWMSESQPFPAVTFGQYEQNEGNTKGVPTTEAVMDIDCWSNIHGFKEVNQIMNAATQALTTSELSLAGGYQSTQGQLAQAQGFIELDPQGNVIRHGVVRIRWYVAYTG